jgi:hypothetical protein
MGKDREGKFHVRKGKPSGSLKTDQGLKSINSESYEDNLEIADKYTVGEEEPAPNVRLRHPNRNVDKREERQQQRSDIQDTKTKRDILDEDDLQPTPTATPILALTKETFTSLATFQSDCCVTFYLPTHPSGVDVNEKMDQTLFKNMLQQLVPMLKKKNMDQLQIDKMLKPGYDLFRDDKFWLDMSAGLAVFVSGDQFQYLKMPCTPKEEILVNTSYYITPLLPMMTNNDYFYLLVLSKKQAVLYRGDAFGMQHIKVDEMPRGVDDVVHFEEKDDQKLWRTGSSGAGGGANYHGIGAGKPDEKENLAIYFDEVDETLCKTALNKENVPLLLAGVEYLIPIYKSVAKYKPIWDLALTGSHEHDDRNQLYEQAKKIMEPYFAERHEKALKNYWNQSATALTSSIPDDVIPAAHYKQVWHLFVQKDQHIWGTFDEMKNKLTIHETQEDADECLVDKAVIKTLLNAGEVHVLPKDKMPGGSVIAALMRYQQ